MNKTLAKILGGLCAVGLLAAGVVYAQPLFSNTLFVLGGNAGVTPQVQAVGTDPNISINLVPKGTGTVQVNGTPISGAGSSLSLGSLTVTTGPTNLTGGLFLTPGTSGVLKGVGARIFHNATDAPTTGTIAETLYTYSMPGNTLAVDGQSIRVHFYATTAANGNNKTIFLTFGATTIFSVGAGAFNNQMSSVVCDVFRTGAATQKALCLSTQGTTNANAALAGQQFVTTPGETLSGAVAILARATTPTAAGDATARAMMIDWHPVGQ